MSSPEGVGGDDLNQNDENHEAAAILDGEEPEFFDVIERFDNNKTAFYQACFDYAEKPDREHLENVSHSATAMLHSFKNSVRQISQDEPDITRGIRTTVGLIKDEDESRNTIFRKLTKCEGFETFNEGDAEGEDSLLEAYLELAEEADSPEEMYEVMIDYFMEMLQKEVEHFASHIAPEETKEEGVAEIPQQINMRRELLDVAKLAVGVASGMLVAGSILRRKKD